MPRKTKEVYTLANKLSRKNQISRSELFGKALRQYIFSTNGWEEIRKWGAETVKRASIKDEKELCRLLSDWRE